MKSLVIVYLLVGLCSCGPSQSLEIYDATDTTTLYECWDIPMPAPNLIVVGIEETMGTWHLYTCDHDCNPVKVEVATGKDGENFVGGVHTGKDARGCEVNSTLNAVVTYSGDKIDIVEKSVVTASEGCDRPGTCNDDAEVTGTKR